MKVIASLGLLAALGGLACATAASGERDAVEAARIQWLRQGAADAGRCVPQIQALTSWAFAISCGATVTYVRCTYGASGPCCETMPDRASALAAFYVFTYHDQAASRVCD